MHIKNPELVTALVVLAIGGVKEFLIDKQPSAFDLGADYVGVSIGIPLYGWFKNDLKFKKTKYKPVKLGN